VSRPLIVLGTGGNALDFLDVVEAINAATATWELVGFLDDAREPGSRLHGIEVLGPLSRATEFRRCWFVNAIGSDKSYRRRPDVVAATGLGDQFFATLIHPGASVSRRSQVGAGTVINVGASVGGEVAVGRHATLGPNCTIGHNVTVEDFAVVAPGAVVSGFVRLGRGCYVGAGAAVKQKVEIAPGALVGLGAVVVRDVPERTTVVGNPARPLRRPAGVPVEAK
jgi:sugar O-acyltransferase (sialic acid O-acetyltransferase NeuD family)